MQAKAYYLTSLEPSEQDGASLLLEPDVGSVGLPLGNQSALGVQHQGTEAEASKKQAMNREHQRRFRQRRRVQ